MQVQMSGHSMIRLAIPLKLGGHSIVRQVMVVTVNMEKVVKHAH